MTVAELIAELKKWPQHLPVVGYVPEPEIIKDEFGAACANMGEGDSQEVSDCRFGGKMIVLECNGMVR